MKHRFSGAAAAAAFLWCSPGVAGGFAVVGTGDGMDMLQAASVLFSSERPDAPVSVPPSVGSGGAVAAVGADRNVLGRVARPLKDAEKAQGLETTPIVRISSAFFVHPSARVRAVTTKQLTDIYSGKIDNWKQVGGADLKIKVVRREEADSTLGELRATMPGWKDLDITSRSKMAMTTQEAIESVRDVEGAIGFGPYSTSLEQGTTVLTVDGRHPTSPRYYSAVTLALLHKASTLTPEAKSFIAFTRSAKAQ
ncbi:MAG TPA: substrate-binding domain-containing protein, partial [Beijerinckiaceae bacterium]|nr:substrate-binding domain-containing protein [Beijerinckiaceae bacterium]